MIEKYFEGIDENYKSSGDYDPILIEKKDMQYLLISDTPDNVPFQFGSKVKDNIISIALEGWFEINNNSIVVQMGHSWDRKYWDLPMGLKYHMDLMKRLLEFRESHFGDTRDIMFEDEGDWCHLYYEFYFEVGSCKTLNDLFLVALDKYNWIEKQVYDVQDKMLKSYNSAASEFNLFKLVEIPELIKDIEIEDNAQRKGALLEELVAKLLTRINGFTISQRVRTETEEIDLVVRNRSTDTTWIKESPMILVECKNWSSNIGKNEYVLFKEKLLNRNERSKVGLLISWNGFASTINKESLRNSKEDIVIILLSKEDIYKMVDEDNVLETLTDFYYDTIC
ncbi:nuclease-related domain-containing protein [Vallitalea guaymasensis]|uniref:nuclease-related domain-containing protein n=1 Tax=Vallitalea guaymasensis TaxID=1185412 RepID=UPI002357F108|nr:restriction endonuclease [Vallitalea guaymasensis]